MQEIQDACVEFAVKGSSDTVFIKVANIAGFVRVADAMLFQGIS